MMLVWGYGHQRLYEVLPGPDHQPLMTEQTEYGFCFVDGCPVSPEKTRELLERIAFIRITHYGKLNITSKTKDIVKIP
jgi:hypothetical protein